MVDAFELCRGYRARWVDREEWDRLREARFAELYPDLLVARCGATAPDAPSESRERLAAAWRNLPRYQLVVETPDGGFVGWSVGRQEARDTLYMSNSAVVPEHRRRGVYSALLARVCEYAVDQGYAAIASRHHPTNAGVLIAKLRAGFVIAGLELDAGYGTLVRLERPLTEDRRRLLEFRVGAAPLEHELAARIGLAVVRPRSGQS